MKNICIIFFLLISVFGSAQNETRTYLYKTHYYYESINLNKDGTFKYNLKTEFTKNEVLGNWQLRNDSILVLDSHPQRSRLEVNENYKKGGKVTFIVKDSEQNSLGYNLYIITDKNKIITYKDQFDKSLVKEKPISFYIVNKSGLHSPIYELKSTKTNYFIIKFEQQRVFENEQWKFHDNKITPLGLDGKYLNYQLE